MAEKISVLVVSTHIGTRHTLWDERVKSVAVYSMYLARVLKEEKIAKNQRKE